MTMMPSHHNFATPHLHLTMAPMRCSPVTIHPTKPSLSRQSSGSGFAYGPPSPGSLGRNNCRRWSAPRGTTTWQS